MSVMENSLDSYKRGAVSIFIVVFTALLISIITVSFIRIMIRDQQRATDSDLSNSAMDSARAGVEDAKRALQKYYNASTPSARTQLENIFASGRCSTAAEILYAKAPQSPEVQVGDASLNQAYTCVKIALNTDDYTGVTGADQQKVVHLRSVSSFSSIRIEWFNKDDISDDFTNFNIANSTSLNQLMAQKDWPANRPPILETQFFQYNTGSFGLSSFDDNGAGGDAGKSNTNTLFLYPSNLPVTTPSTAQFITDARRSSSNDAPRATKCVANPSSVSSWDSNYACRMDITVPQPIGGDENTRDAYLRIVPRYNGMHYRISLRTASGAVVKLKGVQPAVDSTGRASDLFRRVQARVEPPDVIAMPEAAVDTSRSFCKVFTVTSEAGLYNSNTTTCDPSN